MTNPHLHPRDFAHKIRIRLMLILAGSVTSLNCAGIRNDLWQTEWDVGTLLVSCYALIYFSTYIPLSEISYGWLVAVQKSLPFLRLSLSLNKIKIDGLRAPQTSGTAVRPTLPRNITPVCIVINVSFSWRDCRQCRKKILYKLGWVECVG